MTMQQWKQKKVEQFWLSINYALPYDRAEAWVSEHGYNVTLALNNYRALHKKAQAEKINAEFLATCNLKVEIVKL